MADDEQKSFWRRLKEKWSGRQGRSASEQKPGDSQADDLEKSDEAAAPRAGEQPEPPIQIDEPVNDSSKESETPTPSPPIVAQDGEPSVLSTSELKTDKVGRVYAEALLELAQDQGVVDALADEVQQLLPVIEAGGELNRLLTHPAIGDEERSKIVAQVFSGKVSPLLYNMMRLLGDKGRLGSLPEVMAGYVLAVADQRGQINVEAFIATELDAEAARKVADQIGSALGKAVSLTQKVDPSLIGGMKIKVGDQLIDASVASQLRNMKNKMIAAGRS